MSKDKVVWLPKSEVDSESEELYPCYYNDPPTFYGEELEEESVEQIRETHYRAIIPHGT